MKRFAFVVALLFSLPLSAAPYHLELEADPAAPFPFLAKFGKVNLSVYAGGVRAETVWLNGFSRTGTPTITVMNPLGRMYTDVPISTVPSTIAKMGGSSPQTATAPQPPIATPVRGTVRGVAATRYRLVYGPEAWIDVWTTNAIPENKQLKRIVTEFVSGISPATAAAWRAVPGTPLYVELNFSHYKKLPLLRMKSLTFENKGEADALKVGAVYFKAPLLDALWK